MTAQPQVTVKLSVKPNSDSKPENYIDGRNLTIEVTRSLYPSDRGSTANFYEYKYALKTGGKEFTLLKVLGDSGKHIQLILPEEQNSIPNVTSVHAYYWKYNNGLGNTPGKVLLIGVTTESDGTKYYVKSSGSPKWHRFNFGYLLKQSLTPEDLEKKLDDLNCKRNKAIAINLYFVVPQSHFSGGNKYCCYYHYHRGTEKVSVESKTISCTQPDHSSNIISYQKHSITDSKYTLADIKYHEKGGRTGKRTRITASELGFPIKGPLTVSAFYRQENDPKLICIKYGNFKVEWYKKGGDDSQWTRVQGISKDPENIKDCNGSDFKALVNALTGSEKHESHSQLASHSVNTIITTFPVLLPEFTAEARKAPSDDESEGNGLSTEAIIGISAASVGGTGLGGLAVWKGPAILARLIARL
ncbi:hypothetical protein BEWA_049590 [Theileria equi strain WA]|uniref:Uncharacterized protein n=1 Tax=Theileria equi strain WA TaxID=1537102 RepID=L1LAI8_THEEQ|nr:hypothetical protein BEWA_049590 [Theileria equi strain WA]EKX72492.1 hypothetical protein BEWA_049590 [Theileria equi strain WA]|eukprot:XP_004831944.1 hypothetical protein BEWA_049590 [Theileria equi strain WA]